MSTVLEKLASELWAFEETLALPNVSTSAGHDWKKRAIDTRRRISGHIIAFGTIANDLPTTPLSAATAEKFRVHLSSMRHFTALHQSEWPVGMIEPGQHGYAVSLDRLRGARRAF
jgi:hypothetical protein